MLPALHTSSFPQSEFRPKYFIRLSSYAGYWYGSSNIL